MTPTTKKESAGSQEPAAERDCLADAMRMVLEGREAEGDTSLSEDEDVDLVNGLMVGALEASVPESFDRLGRYEILSPVRQGGMGHFYRAWDPTFERIVGIKVLKPELASKADARERFKHEGLSAARVKHPGIVQVFDAEISDERAFIVFEWVDGEQTLEDYLDDLQSFEKVAERPFEEIARMFSAIADALGAAHENGIIHRDLKPANILLAPGMQPMIADFGVAKLVGRPLKEDRRVVVGTEHYISPEVQRHGAEAAGPDADIYAFGVCLHEALMGEKPEHPGPQRAKRIENMLAAGVTYALAKACAGLLVPNSARLSIRVLRDQLEEVFQFSKSDRTPLAAKPMEARNKNESTLLSTPKDDAIAAYAWVEGLGSDGRSLGVRKELVRETLQEARGELVRIQDGCYLVAFESQNDAALFSILLQQHHCRRGSDGDVRIALHDWVKPESLDEELPQGVDNPAVELALELLQVTVPRQTLMSLGTFDLARRYLTHESVSPQSIEWKNQGVYRLSRDVAVGEVTLVDYTFSSGGFGVAAVEKGLADGIVEGWRPAIGKRVPQRKAWVLERKLGEGGFGEVWLACREESNERHVFKFCFDDENLRGLKRELRLLRLLKAALSHRSDIARLVDWDLDDAPYFLESEYSYGGDLSDWFRRRGAEQVPLEHRLMIVARVAEALEAYHSVGIIHKDIKPSNILIIDGGSEEIPSIQLIDFGLGAIFDRQLLKEQMADNVASIASVSQRSMSHWSAGEQNSGTLRYMAPELRDGSGQEPTTKSDIYSLGVVFYQMISGRFGVGLEAGWEDDIADSLLLSDLKQCVARNPEQRLASAADLSHQLQTIEERRDKRELTRRANFAQSAFSLLEAIEKRELGKISSRLGLLLLVLILCLAFFAIVEMTNLAGSIDDASISDARYRYKAEADLVAREIGYNLTTTVRLVEDAAVELLSADLDVDGSLGSILKSRHRLGGGMAQVEIPEEKEVVAPEVLDLCRSRLLFATDQAWANVVNRQVGAREKYERAGAAESHAKIDSNKADMIAAVPVFSWVIADSQGFVLARIPRSENVLGSNYHYRDWFHGQGIEDRLRSLPPVGATHISNPYISTAREGETMVSLSTPLRGEGGEVVGLLLGTMRVRDLASALRRAGSLDDRVERRDLGSHFVIVDHRENIVYHPFDPMRRVPKKGGGQMVPPHFSKEGAPGWQAIQNFPSGFRGQLMSGDDFPNAGRETSAPIVYADPFLEGYSDQDVLFGESSADIDIGDRKLWWKVVAQIRLAECFRLPKRLHKRLGRIRGLGATCSGIFAIAVLAALAGRSRWVVFKGRPSDQACGVCQGGPPGLTRSWSLRCLLLFRIPFLPLSWPRFFTECSNCSEAFRPPEGKPVVEQAVRGALIYGLLRGSPSSSDQSVRATHLAVMQRPWSQEDFEIAWEGCDRGQELKDTLKPARPFLRGRTQEKVLRAVLLQAAADGRFDEHEQQWVLGTAKALNISTRRLRLAVEQLALTS